MRSWLWKNVDTGEVVEHTHATEPPTTDAHWTRIYSVGVGSVSGAGGSPARPIKVKKIHGDPGRN